MIQVRYFHNRNALQFETMQLHRGGLRPPAGGAHGEVEWAEEPASASAAFGRPPHRTEGRKNQYFNVVSTESVPNWNANRPKRTQDGNQNGTNVIKKEPLRTKIEKATQIMFWAEFQCCVDRKRAKRKPKSTKGGLSWKPKRDTCHQKEFLRTKIEKTTKIMFRADTFWIHFCSKTCKSCIRQFIGNQ
jgi:hypothetical protein